MIKQRLLLAFSAICLAVLPACGSNEGGEAEAAAGSGGLAIADPASGAADASCDVPNFGAHECVQLHSLSPREQWLMEAECVSVRGTVKREADSCPAVGRIGSCVSPLESAPGKTRLKYYYEGYSVESAKAACQGEDGTFH
jgi:hypothetical protein